MSHEQTLQQTAPGRSQPTVRPVLRALLAPPPLSDGAKPWVRHSVYLLSLGLAVGLTIALVDNVVTGRTIAVHLLLVQLAVVGLALVLNRYGPSRQAARVLALSLPILATGLLIGDNIGFHGVAALIFPASLIVAGLLLERRTLVTLTVETVACVALVIGAEARGLVGHRPPDAPFLQNFIEATVILVVTAIGVGLVAGHMREALVKTRRSEAALQKANDALAERSERLKESEARYRALIDLAADAILVADPEGRVTEANLQATELTGYAKNELLGGTIEQLFLPEEREPLRHDLVDERQALVRERLVTRKDGSVVPVEMSSRRMPKGEYQSILRDASERKRAEGERRKLETRLHEARRMEAIGRLAGGVAHDYNNLLSAITGNLTLARRDVPSGARTHRWLKEADAAAWRAADITRQLLSFANQRDVEWETLDLRELVEGLRPRLAGLISEQVRLDVRLADGPCPVCVDRGQIERALVNLTVNGRDVMPNGGTLTCEVGHAAGDDVRRARPTAGPGPYVVLSVTDDGSGMSDDVRSRLFEPFFTTKLAGSTAGLGLALVYAVAAQHHGWIDVESAPDRGTTFRLHLPQAAAAGPSPPRQSPSVS